MTNVRDIMCITAVRTIIAPAVTEQIFDAVAQLVVILANANATSGTCSAATSPTANLVRSRSEYRDDAGHSYSYCHRYL